MNLTETELDTLKSSKNETEWNTTCDAIKRARGGQYPPDWYARVVVSGIAATTQAGWSK